MAEGVNWDYELRNGWSPETLIILQGMKEIRDDVKELHEVQSRQATNLALVAVSVDGLPQRVRELEDDKTQRDERKQFRRRAVELGSGFIGLIVVPVLIALFEMGVL